MGQSQKLRAKWATGVKGKGKGKGKGSKGKGKGKKVWRAVGTEEERMKAVEKLEKQVEKKRRDSLREMDKIDKQLAPKKAKFKKVKAIRPEAKGLNLMVKCVKCTPVEGATST